MSDTAFNEDDLSILIDEIKEAEPLVVREQANDNAFGALTLLMNWVKAVQGSSHVRCGHPRVALFFGHHGFAVDEHIQNPENIDDMLQKFTDGDARLNRLCNKIDADFNIYELDLDQGTDNALLGTAMPHEDAIKAMSYGMMAVDPALDMISIAGLGAGSYLSAYAVMQLMQPEADILPLSLKPFERKLVERMVERHKDSAKTPFQKLCAVGGFEISAMSGAILAAHLAGVPVVLDGIAALAAAVVVNGYTEKAIQHCLIADQTNSGVKEGFLESLGLLIGQDISARLGPGIDGALILSLIQNYALCEV